MLAKHIRRACQFFEEGNPLRDFQTAYVCLDFGYRYAKAAAEDPEDSAWFPPGEEWIWRAYMMFRRGRHNDAVAAAVRLREGSHGPEGARLRAMRHIAEALLLAKASGYKLNINEMVGEESATAIDAYGSLFYDVIDRSRDQAWLASVVYPRSRVEEFFSTYFDESAMPDIVRRLAYNKGPEAALYAAGFKTFFESSSVREDAAIRFERKLLENGLLLAEMNLLNYPGVHGIAAAKQIVAAAKQGGADQEQEQTLVRVAPAIAAVMRRKFGYAPVALEDAKFSIVPLQEAHDVS